MDEDVLCLCCPITMEIALCCPTEMVLELCAEVIIEVA